MSRWTTKDFVDHYLEWTDDDVEFTDLGIEFYLDDQRYALSLKPLPPTLEELGLEARDVVRFRERPGANWKMALVKGTNLDGSVELIQESNGFYRSIHPEFIEKKEEGKRGASKWISITPG